MMSEEEIEEYAGKAFKMLIALIMLAKSDDEDTAGEFDKAVALCSRDQLENLLTVALAGLTSIANLADSPTGLKGLDLLTYYADNWSTLT